MRRACVAASTALLFLSAGCATVDTAPEANTPAANTFEAAPARNWRGGAMVAAANPLAVDAGLKVLGAGGSAVDAAIAIQAVLGLVEPQSSGIGGGAFLLHYDAATGDVVAYDGREVAPVGASSTMFLDESGKPLSFPAAIQSGRSVGVPGVVAMLELAHREHGRLAWAQPWQAAIELAERGFAVSPRMREIAQMAERFTTLAPDARRYLTTDGKTILPVGHVLRNTDYAATLRQIATQGARAFYSGPIAQSIIAAVAQAPRPGTLSLADLASYRAVKHEPVCRPYRIYEVCGMTPPSSGGIAVLSVLGILANFDMAANDSNTPQGWHLLIEAQRLAYADRDKYVGDDRFVHVPVDGLLDTNYLQSRAALISRSRAMATVSAGTPPGAPPSGADHTGPSTGTSHFVVVDARGNVVSMTTTVESLFGSQRMASGFFLNNQLTDFSFRAVDDAGVAIANAPAPGKKPRSSMSPTLVFKDGQFLLGVGSPGGNSIIGYVSKTLVGVLDWGLTPDAAIELPNVVARGPVLVEESRFDAPLLEQLKSLGHTFRPGRGAEGSGLHAIMVRPDGTLEGGADSRREGEARALDTAGP
ncbi:MAG: gamma-glutamyltransferase [Proteobacteria bacterium]|nr:gamma-glutamyltransferase [Pseudomonadota bacterium]